MKSISERIAILREMHGALNAQIDKIERDPSHREEGGVHLQQLKDLKKKRLAFRDEINRLERVEFEERTQRVEWGDE